MLDSLYVEGEKRYTAQIPPGYADSPRKGEEEFIFAGVTYKRKFGDLIIWKQIIEFIQSNDKEIRNLVFISGEKKKDWVNIVDSQGNKNLGARHELVEEIQREANIEKFLLLSHEDYMRLGDAAFGITVSDAVLEDIEEHEMRSLLNQAHRNFIEQSQGLEIPIHGLATIDHMKDYSEQLERLKPITGISQLKDYSSLTEQLERLKPITGINQLKDYSSLAEQIERLKPITGINQLRDYSSLAEQHENMNKSKKE